MKHAFLFIFICFSIIIQGQNLVPNPSFEEYYFCPLSAGGLGVNGGDPYIMDWYSMQWTPDYMHYCAGEGASNYPTDNAWGYQEPFDGEGYVAIATFFNFLDDREFIAVELSETLEVGQSYYLSLFASDNDGGEIEVTDCATNNIGMKLLVNPPYYWINEGDNNTLLPDNNAMVNYNEVLLDSTGWTHVSGNIVADQPYTHLVIGNFFDNENTLLEQTNLAGCEAVYYIDYVCVSTSEEGCSIPDGIGEPSEIAFDIYPNPSHNVLNFYYDFQYEIEVVEVFDDYGKSIVIEYSVSNESIDISGLSKGLYLVTVKFKNSGLILSNTFIKL